MICSASSFFPHGIECPPLVVTPPDSLSGSGAVEGGAGHSTNTNVVPVAVTAGEKIEAFTHLGFRTMSCARQAQGGFARRSSGWGWWQGEVGTTRAGGDLRIDSPAYRVSGNEMGCP